MALTSARGRAAPACTITWDGSAGTTSWHTATNWDTNVVPGAADHVCIVGSTVVYSTGTTSILSLQAAGPVSLTGGILNLTDTGNASNVATFSQSSGTLGGAGALNVGTAYNWSGGTMSDAATTTIAGAATLTQSGFTTLANGRLIENAGIYDFTADVSVNASGVVLPAIHNTGTLRKSAGLTNAQVFPPLENDGSVTASSGTLILRAGTGTATGSFGGAAATGTVELDAGTYTLAGATLPGHVKLAGGTLQVADASSVTVSGANSMTAGTVGGTGTFALTSGTWTWTGGTMSDAGTTSIAAAATVSQNGFTTLANGRMVENAGTYEFTADVSVNVSGVVVAAIHNTGTLRKSAGANNAQVFAALDNDGSVEASSGTLILRAGAGTSAGSFGGAAATGTVEFDAGTFTLAGASFPGHVKLAGATLQVAAASTATASGPNTMTAGTLGGTGTFAVTGGTWTWTGGTMSDAGTTSIAASATLSQNGFATLAAGRLVENAGTYELTADVSLNVSGAAPAIHNTGMLRKSAGVSNAQIFAPLENDGSVQSSSGTLILRAGTGTGSGSFGGAAATGTVSFTAGTFTLSGATLLGSTSLAGATITIPAAGNVTASGTNSFSSGTLGGMGTFTLAGGTLTWSGGTMTESGTTQVAVGATLSQSGATTLGAGRLLENAGTYQFLSDTFAFEGVAPASSIHNTGTISKTGGVGEATIFVGLANAGTVTSTSGRLSLFKSAPGAQAGTFTGVSDAAHTTFRGGTFTLGAAVTLQGTVEIDGANVAVSSGQTLAVPSRLLLKSGELRGPGSVNVTGTLAWNGGTQVGPGTTTVALAGKIDVDGCSTDLEDGRVVQNNGTINLLHHTSIGAFGDARSTINNAHVIAIDDTTGSCIGDNELGGDLLVNNTPTGTITKSGSTVAGTRVTRIDGTVDNDGFIDVHAGELDMTSTSAVTQTGAFTSTGGTNSTVAFEDGTFSMGAGATLAGQTAIDGADVQVLDGATLTVAASDTLAMSSGTVGGAGTFEIAGKLDWTGGRHTGNGSTVIDVGGTSTFHGSSFDLGLDEGRVLVNRGSIVWTTGDFFAGQGTSFVNVGSLEMKGTSTFGGSGFFGFGSGSLLHNVGLF